MPRHLEQVLAHAENQLAATGAKRPTEVLPLYKKFLKIEEHRLRLNHQAGGGGREICARRVDLVDVLLRHVFTAAAAVAESEQGPNSAPLALVALGGYGRGELNPFSDVDVMLLHGGGAGSVSPYIEQVVEQILYLLWDIGFKVGHSTRSGKGSRCPGQPRYADENRDARVAFSWRATQSWRENFVIIFAPNASRGTNANMSRCECRTRRHATKIRRQRLHAGTESEERMRRPARLSKSCSG